MLLEQLEEKGLREKFEELASSLGLKGEQFEKVKELCQAHYPGTTEHTKAWADLMRQFQISANVFMKFLNFFSENSLITTAKKPPTKKVVKPKGKEKVMETEGEKKAEANPAHKRNGTVIDRMLVQVVGSGKSFTLAEINALVHDASNYSEQEVNNVLYWWSGIRAKKPREMFKYTETDGRIQIDALGDWHPKKLEELSKRSWYKQLVGGAPAPAESSTTETPAEAPANQ